ncbi:hypothetical protein MLD38_039662 [Melastoma candidum]|uniref:Uncharacterized protein n=1 Tax=Melastoma candidum TaxID=119954 RepID=A0ACB9L2V7_9MYRT|nr:hypothetical protein MLD38_039662 [Melastoma candidum]
MRRKRRRDSEYNNPQPPSRSGVVLSLPRQSAPSYVAFRCNDSAAAAVASSRDPDSASILHSRTFRPGISSWLRVPSYVYSQLVLADDAVMQGDSTPLRVVSGFYFINLESIAVVDKVIYIFPYVFTMIGRRDGALSGNVNRDLTGFPTVTFRFEGGAKLGIQAASMFYLATQQELSMAVSLHKDGAGVSLIGLMVQQYCIVGFDMDHGKQCLQRMVCQLLRED